MMKKVIFAVYALMCYVIFFATFLYMIGFVENVPDFIHTVEITKFFPKTLDTGTASMPVLPAILTDLLLIAVFGLQHSVMARQSFKRKWTRIIPKPVERSTFVLFASAALVFLYISWQPVRLNIWNLDMSFTGRIFFGLSMTAWIILLVTTFLINHFDLFGLRQVYFYITDRELTHIDFRNPLFYKFVRHPLYLSFLMIFWFAPVMTLGHLVFSLGMTTYIFIGIYHEEKDLIHFYGEVYRDYKSRVPGIIPFTLITSRKIPYQVPHNNLSAASESATSSDQLGQKFERIVRAMERQPEIATGHLHSEAVFREGLACDVASGPWRFKTDMSKTSGGNETGPSPGNYMSMALAGCQAITTLLWAAHYGVNIESLTVNVDIDKDSRGLFGVSDQPARWEKIKYHVDIESSDTESQVRKVLDAAYLHSPMRDNLEYGFKIEHDADIHSMISQDSVY